MKCVLGLLGWLGLAAWASAEVVGREVQYEAGGVAMRGWLAYDDAVEGERPGVLVVHEWWGHNPYARKRAEQLAAMGYTALAVDMFGQGKTADHPKEAGEFAGEAMANLEVAKARFDAALAVLRAEESVDAAKIAAIGYCFGGGVVLHMARMGSEVLGVVSFHGSLAAKQPAREGQVTARVLVCHGADDGFIPEEEIAAFKQEMETAGIDYQFKEYAGAVHSFTNPEATAMGERLGLPIRYHAEADRQSWADMQTFFNELFAE